MGEFAFFFWGRVTTPLSKLVVVSQEVHSSSHRGCRIDFEESGGLRQARLVEIRICMCVWNDMHNAYRS